MQVKVKYDPYISQYIFKNILFAKYNSLLVIKLLFRYICLLLLRCKANIRITYKNMQFRSNQFFIHIVKNQLGFPVPKFPRNCYQQISFKIHFLNVYISVYLSPMFKYWMTCSKFVII